MTDAEIKNQLETAPDGFDIERIKNVEEELDRIIYILNQIKKEGSHWGKEQKKLLATAKKYRNELQGINRELKEGANGMERWADGAKNLGYGISDLGNALQSPIDGMAKLGQHWGKADQAANDFGKSVGLSTKAVAQLRDQTIKFGNDVHIGIKYNTSIAEMIKLQEEYSKTVGRNLQISDKQRETLLATSKLLKGNTNEFVSKLENMGVGLEKSGDIAAKMFNEASKSGISFEKYSQSVTQNLTKVQNYGFKNGVEGLTAMAKKAAEVNLNIAEAFKVADKIQTGGIESAIKMGANLQVLGGTFSQFGDPMGMLYQGLNDMEGLQDRMIKMFSGLGRIENGQVRVNANDRLRINAAAQAMGISSEEMFNMINRQAVRGVVDKQIAGTAASRDEELAELIRNTATLDKDNNAVVNIGGKQKAVKDITDKDKEYLKNLQKSEADDIKDIAQILRGYTDTQGGFTKEIENKKAQSFQNIGKATKYIYDVLGKSNLALEIIKDAVLALTVTQTLGSFAGGIGRTARNMGAGGGGSAAGGMAGGGRRVGGGVPGGTNTPGMATTLWTTSVGKGGQTVVTNYKGSGYSQRTLEKLQKKYGGEIVADETGIIASGSKLSDAKLETAANKIQAKETAKAARAAKFSKFASSGWGKAAGGAALGGVMTGIGYLADGSFTSGNRADVNKAAAGTVGSIILGAAGGLLGPMGAMLGAEAGKLLGELVGKRITNQQTKNRTRKREELTKAFGKNSEKGKVIEQLSGDYSKRQLDKIAKALSGGELSDALAKKIAKSGDTELIQKFASEKTKAKLSQKAEEIKAKVEKGDFSMETGEFMLNKANINISNLSEGATFASGGKLTGPSDINGPGMPILGSNVVVGGGEFVVNAESTRKNEPILNAINNGAVFKFANGGVIPIPEIKFANGGVINSPKIGFSNGGKINLPGVKLANGGVIPVPDVNFANGGKVNLPDVKMSNGGVVNVPDLKFANGGIISEPPVKFENGGIVQVPKVKFANGGVIPVPDIKFSGGGIINKPKISLSGGGIIDKPVVKFENGGIIDIPKVRFANGGVMPVPQIRYSNGGVIVKPQNTVSDIKPSTLKNPMSPIKVVEKTNRPIETVQGPKKIDIDPIKLDISGTIKLEAGGQQIDLNSIVNNPAFLTQISQMIERRLSDNIDGGNFKNLRKNKQHTF